MVPRDAPAAALCVPGLDALAARDAERQPVLAQADGLAAQDAIAPHAPLVDETLVLPDEEPVCAGIAAVPVA